MSKKKREKKNNIPIPILMIISAVLIFAIYISLSTLVLAFWGETALGTIDSYHSRMDSSFTDVNRSRTVSKSYSFMAKGKEYRGYVIYSSDEQWPSLSEGETRLESISYLSFFPLINKPTTLADFNDMGDFGIIYHFLAPVASGFLLFLVIRTYKREKSKVDKKKAREAVKNTTRAHKGDPLTKGGIQMKKFGSLSEAAQYAVNITGRWRFVASYDEYDSSRLLIESELSDEENPADEGSYYVVADNGAIGFSEDGAEVDWLFSPLP
ncbi:MAG: hypothetical protein GX763_08850 [Clostridiaceae bacterium]|nr:hypothetical protein [Clostridiaceae bacterium]